MKKRTKVDGINKAANREERYTLFEGREKMYERFRTNIRILRAVSGLSGVEAAQAIGLRDGKHVLNLEYGRCRPDIDELILIAQHYHHKTDDILNKDIQITFIDGKQ